jgi:hypothetical protein
LVKAVEVKAMVTIYYAFAGAEGWRRYSSNTLASLALEVGGWSAPSPGHFTSEKDPVPVVQ